MVRRRRPTKTVRIKNFKVTVSIRPRRSIKTKERPFISNVEKVKRRR